MQCNIPGMTPPSRYALALYTAPLHAHTVPVTHFSSPAENLPTQKVTYGVWILMYFIDMNFF